MIYPITNIALIAAALGSGLIAGIFFRLLDVHHAGLRQASRRSGHRRHAIDQHGDPARSPFMVVFLLTVALSVFIAVMAIVYWRGGVSILMIAGATLYIVTTFLSTIVFNVPLNDALDKVDGRSAGGAAQLWTTFLNDWTKMEPFAHGGVTAGLLRLRSGSLLVGAIRMPCGKRRRDGVQINRDFAHGCGRCAWRHKAPCRRR